jgi:hypothetical protein
LVLFPLNKTKPPIKTVVVVGHCMVYQMLSNLTTSPIPRHLPWGPYYNSYMAQRMYVVARGW